MDYDIEYINETQPTVHYDYRTVAEDTIEHFTAVFEAEHGLEQGEDIGGLIVYNNGDAVYDYENFVGWVR